jgi:hypothetical protein
MLVETTGSQTGSMPFAFRYFLAMKLAVRG